MMMESLDDVAALTDQKQKIEQYRAALQRVLDTGSTEQCKEFVNHSKESFSCHVSMPVSIPDGDGGSHPGACCPRTPCVPPAVLSDAVSLVISRQLLQHFTQEIKLKLPHDSHKEVAT